MQIGEGAGPHRWGGIASSSGGCRIVREAEDALQRWAKMHSLFSTRFSRRAGTRALPAPKLIFALCYCWSLR